MESWLTIFGASGTALTALGLLIHRFKARRAVLTREALYVLAMATRDAEQRGHRPLSVTHLTLALLADPSIARSLAERAVSPKAVYDDVERLLPPRAEAPLELTPADVEPGVEALLRAARHRFGVVPAPEHIFRALLRSKHHAIRAVFERHGFTARGWSRVSSQSAAAEAPPPSTFGVLEPDATRLMLTTDRDGFAVVGTYERHEGERLAADAMRLARGRGYPLVVTVEEAGRVESMSRVRRWLLHREAARRARASG